MDQHISSTKQAPFTIDGKLEYEVQDIMQKHICHCHVEYLVCWQGYPDYDATWEPLSNLHNTQQIIDGFESVEAPLS